MVIKDIFKGIWLVFIVFCFLFILIGFNWLVGSEWYIYDPPCSRPRGWGPDGYQAGHAWHASGLDHAGTTIRDIQTTSGKYRNIQKAPVGPALVTWCYGESPWAQERSPWTIQYTILFVMFLYLLWVETRYASSMILIIFMIYTCENLFGVVEALEDVEDHPHREHVGNLVDMKITNDHSGKRAEIVTFAHWNIWFLREQLIVNNS